MAVKCLITFIYVQKPGWYAKHTNECHVQFPQMHRKTPRTLGTLGAAKFCFSSSSSQGSGNAPSSDNFSLPPSSLKLLGGKMKHIILPSVKAYSCPNLVKILALCLFLPCLWTWPWRLNRNNPKMPSLCPFPCSSAQFSPQITSSWNSFSTSKLVSKWIHSEHQMAPSQLILYKNCSTKIC